MQDLKLKKNTGITTTTDCRTTREGDEWVCSCGLRWDTDEDDPHPKTAEEHIARARYEINKNANS